MTLKMMFELCIMVCNKHLAKNANACLTYNDEQVKYSDLKQELEKVEEWCYNMSTSSLRKCIQCQDCVRYSQASTVSKGKANIYYICDIDHQPKPKDHYCGYAKEK